MLALRDLGEPPFDRPEECLFDLGLDRHGGCTLRDPIEWMDAGKSGSTPCNRGAANVT
jgi:hypothetical protein